MFRSLALVTAATLGLSAAALAQTEPKPQPDKTDGKAATSVHRSCFFSRDVRGFAAPDDKTLYLRVRAKDVYRLDMKGRCPELDWEHKIALDSRGSSAICGAIDVTVLVKTPIGMSRCSVETLTRLTPEEVAALPKKSRP
ncbi:MAG: DUF6491 family protein [Phenylobacterium sp.]